MKLSTSSLLHVPYLQLQVNFVNKNTNSSSKFCFYPKQTRNSINNNYQHYFFTCFSHRNCTSISGFYTVTKHASTNVNSTCLKAHNLTFLGLYLNKILACPYMEKITEMHKVKWAGLRRLSVVFLFHLN